MQSGAAHLEARDVHGNSKKYDLLVITPSKLGAINLNYNVDIKEEPRGRGLLTTA